MTLRSQVAAVATAAGSNVGQAVVLHPIASTTVDWGSAAVKPAYGVRMNGGRGA
jgi:hypothetical protein